VLHFLVRGAERKTYELRLSPDEVGFELMVRDEGGQESVEYFTTIDRLLGREHELLSTWRELGWDVLSEPRPVRANGAK
jgi:hypothetical protein